MARRRGFWDVVAAAMAGVPRELPQLEPAAIVRPQETWRRGGTVGMQGYAPTVTVSKNRHGTKCQCGDVVLTGVRHVCMHNAHNYLDSLTREEYYKVITQLRARLAHREMT